MEHAWLLLIPLIILGGLIGKGLGGASRRADKW